MVAAPVLLLGVGLVAAGFVSAGVLAGVAGVDAPANLIYTVR